MTVGKFGQIFQLLVFGAEKGRLELHEKTLQWP
jgi:hypothetical protein